MCMATEILITKNLRLYWLKRLSVKQQKRVSKRILQSFCTSPLVGELKERRIVAFMVMGVQIYEPQPLFAVLEQDIILFSALIALFFSVRSYIMLLLQDFTHGEQRSNIHPRPNNKTN